VKWSLMTKQNKVLFLLFAVVAAIYAPSLFNDFVYDDIIVIQGDSTPLSSAGVKDIFTKPHYPLRLYYRPVVMFSFVLQNNLPFGDAPLVYHLINVLLAGVLAIFIYKLLSLRAFKLGNRAAFWSALLVVAHPVTSSSVYPAASGRETLMPVL